jgi:hypothetical protein
MRKRPGFALRSAMEALARDGQPIVVSREIRLDLEAEGIVGPLPRSGSRFPAAPAVETAG